MNDNTDTRGMDRLERLQEEERARRTAMQAKVELEDFYAYMPMHKYIYIPSGQLWPGSSVNARIPPIDTGEVDEDGSPIKIKASTWLDQNRPVEQMTWAPGHPSLILNRIIARAGWINRSGARVFNLYQPPTIAPGNPGEAQRWLDHIETIYPDDWQHIVSYFAHRRQRPQEKINHALLLGGAPGIGKDTIIYPVAVAVGVWNTETITPVHLLGRFNSFVKSVLLIINEARDLGEVNRYAFYEHLKPYTAAPPEHHRCDEKGLQEYSVQNVCGVVITSNYLHDGCYLPADDRRHYVCWSRATEADFAPGYFDGLYNWFDNGGAAHVAAYLDSFDLSNFNAKTPPRKTPAFWEIVDANHAPGESELQDVIDSMSGWRGSGADRQRVPPAVITITRLVAEIDRMVGQWPVDDSPYVGLKAWLKDRTSRRIIPKRLADVGYVMVRNPDAEDGLWVIGGRRQAVYGHTDLSPADRLAAARKL